MALGKMTIPITVSKLTSDDVASFDVQLETTTQTDGVISITTDNQLDVEGALIPETAPDTVEDDVAVLNVMATWSHIDDSKSLVCDVEVVFKDVDGTMIDAQRWGQANDQGAVNSWAMLMSDLVAAFDKIRGTEAYEDGAALGTIEVNLYAPE